MPASRPSLRAIFQQSRRRASEGHLGLIRQLAEMVVLRIFYGLGPGHYHTARYWRRELTWNFKTGFFTYKKYRRYIRKLNPLPYQKISQHKVSEKALLHLMGLPTPRFIGRLHNKFGLTSKGQPLRSADDLRRLLEDLPDLKAICFKLVEGHGGEGFHAIKIIRDKLKINVLSLKTGKDQSLETFLNSTLSLNEDSEYIIEEYLIQHPVLAKLNPTSVNTLRIWAGYSHDKGEFSVAAYLRVGRAGSVVDNAMQGGEVFPIEIHSGIVGQSSVKDIFSRPIDKHPDTGEPITGVRLPYFKEALELAQQSVTVFPHIAFAGVDVAITTMGPSILELNVEPDPLGAIFVDRSHKDLFSVFTDTA